MCWRAGLERLATTSTAVSVSEREWSVSLGRLKAPHGRITFYVTNYGQDDHNVKIRKHGTQYGFTGRIPSGGHATLTVSLKPGVYTRVLRAAGPPPAGHDDDA